VVGRVKCIPIKVNIAYVVQACAVLIMVGCLIHLFRWKRREQTEEALREPA